MSNQINNGGPAYPIQVNSNAIDVKDYYGLSMRDWFAGMATEDDICDVQERHKKNNPKRKENGMIDGNIYIYPTRQESRYIHADAMLSARKDQP